MVIGSFNHKELRNSYKSLAQNFNLGYIGIGLHRRISESKGKVVPVLN